MPSGNIGFFSVDFRVRGHSFSNSQRAGGGISRQGLFRSASRSTFGRGRVAAVRANHLLTGRSRLVTVKARVVRHTARSAPLGAHLDYLRREGVARDGEKARLFGPETEDTDPKAFAERCEKDRHHFRFIVSPPSCSPRRCADSTSPATTIRPETAPWRA
jgi:hypothetical protein